MALAQAVVLLGAEISNYPFFIKMNPNDSVPEGIPNRSYEDENGNTVILDWINWKSANFEIHTLTDGNTYIAGEANTGDSVVFNDFSAVFADCIDAATFTSLLPVE